MSLHFDNSIDQIASGVRISDTNDNQASPLQQKTNQAVQPVFTQAGQALANAMQAAPHSIPANLLTDDKSSIDVKKVNHLAEKTIAKFSEHFASRNLGTRVLKVIAFVLNFFSKALSQKLEGRIQSRIQIIAHNPKIMDKARSAFSTGLKLIQARQEQLHTTEHAQTTFRTNRAVFSATDTIQPLKIPDSVAHPGLLAQTKGNIKLFKSEFSTFILPTLNNLFSDVEVAPLESSCGIWTAQRLTRSIASDASSTSTPAVVEEGHVNPTSERGLVEAGNSLHNIYINQRGASDAPTRSLNVTTGVIDSNRRADEFVSVVAQAVKDGKIPRSPIRISMNQLNSYIREGKLIRNEAALVSYIQQKIQALVGGEPPAKVTVLHQNTGFNATTEWPLIGERDKCNKQNLSAMAQFVKMLDEDEGRHPALQNLLKGLKLPGSDPEPTSEELKTTLTEISKRLETALKESSILLTSPQLYARCTALKQRLEVVTGQKTLSPAADFAMQHLLNITSGCITQVNCKSGLDRTGIARAIIATVDAMVKDGVAFNTMADFIRDIDTHTARVNEAYDQLKNPTTEQWQSATRELCTASPPTNQMNRLAILFQQNMGNELMSVGLPITALSTGSPGLKHGHENRLAANPHLGAFLPRYSVKDDGSILHLVSNENRLTRAGLDIFSQGSKLRGA